MGDSKTTQHNGHNESATNSLDEDFPSPKTFGSPAPKLSPPQLKLSTSELYESKKLTSGKSKNDIGNFTGKYAEIRARLDYSYHRVPNKSRQALQDSLIEDILSGNHEECQGAQASDSKPCVLFTAGAMASGKGHTLRCFLKSGKVDLPSDFVWVDPDKIARALPERQQYLDFDVDSAPEKLHGEASMLQEIASHVARDSKRSLVVDGSLSDGDWFKSVMAQYRKSGYEIGIFFVTANVGIMQERAEARQKDTGRQTDPEHIERTAREAPKSVEVLANKEHVDRVRIIDNSSNDRDPHLVYDSAGDACFEKEHKTVDVMKWVRKAEQTGEKL